MNIRRGLPILLGMLPPSLGAAGFTRLGPEATGVAFTNTLPEMTAAANQIRLNGSGVALADADGDGLCDVYACALDGSNALFRNLGGWRFTNITASAIGPAPGGWTDSTGAAFADVDGDGDMDLLVNGIGRGTRLLLNDGTGRFTLGAGSGLSGRGGATSLALADIDGDGDLDLYVANYRTTTLRTTGLELLNIDGRRSVKPEERDMVELAPDGRVLEHGEPDILYRNEGGGRFVAVPWTGGAFVDEDGRALTRPPFDWGLTAAFRDLDGDGTPDLYVCNDFHSPDRVWLNDGRGRFRAAPRLMLRHTPTFSMSVDFADFDRDGRQDFIVADMLSRDPARRLMQLAGGDPYVATPGVFDDRPQFDRNTLQWNRGDGTYADIAPYAGVEATDWTWSIACLDVDLDGFEDLLCTTGHMFDTQDLDAEARIRQAGPWTKEKTPLKLLRFPSMAQPRQAWRNNGDLTFTETGAAWGFADRGVAHGMAFADLDGDGDADVVVNELNGPLGLHRNEADAPRLAVRLEGRAPNTRGVGARLRVVVPGMPVQSAEIASGGRYLSSDEGTRVFAGHGPATVEVRWRSGRTTTLTNVLSGVVIVREAGAVDAVGVKAAEPAPLFAATPLQGDAGGDPYVTDDFLRQPLLPRRLSDEWPGVAWSDLDGDGAPELVAGNGAGGRLRAWKWNAGRPEALTMPGSLPPLERSLHGIVVVAGAAGSRAIITAASNWEDASAARPQLLMLDAATGLPAGPAFPGAPETAGALCASDVDGDGDLDLFVGARVLPGLWPRSGPSRWYRNDGGVWKESSGWSAAFADAGLVGGAVATDLDGDGRPDLALATQLGPVRVWRNRGGAGFEEFTAAAGLGGHLGLWRGIAAADFDGDGRMDLAVANDGLNAGLLSAREQGVEPTPHGPLVLSGDIDGDGRPDILEGRRDRAGGRDVPERDLEALMTGLPLLPERFATYAAFNRAALAEVAGAAYPRLARQPISWLPSTVFLNRGGRFEARPLPREAQFSPAFGITAADLDGDGNIDLFLAQNFHGGHVKSPRMDAGRGLVLLGDGRGGFRALSGGESGVRLYAEQRGAAAGDFDGDGRMDLAVGMNRGPVTILHNVGARPALRVFVDAGPANPSGIGVSVRLGDGGPRHEIHAGSGWYSQDHAVVLLPADGSDRELEVAWPDGVRERHAAPPGTTTHVIRRKSP